MDTVQGPKVGRQKHAGLSKDRAIDFDERDTAKRSLHSPNPRYRLALRSPEGLSQEQGR